MTETNDTELMCSFDTWGLSDMCVCVLEYDAKMLFIGLKNSDESAWKVFLGGGIMSF